MSTQNILTPIKWDNGVIDKPKERDYKTEEGHTIDEYYCDLERYNNAKTVCRLVDMVEFWKLNIAFANPSVSQIVVNGNDYVSLIDRELTLDQFIPCVDGVPVEEPKGQKGFMYSRESFEKEMEQYQEAKEAVIFEGWELVESSMAEYCLMWRSGQLLFYTPVLGWLMEGNNHLLETINQAINNGVDLLWNGKLPKSK